MIHVWAIEHASAAARAGAPALQTTGPARATSGASDTTEHPELQRETRRAAVDLRQDKAARARSRLMAARIRRQRGRASHKMQI